MILKDIWYKWKGLLKNLKRHEGIIEKKYIKEEIKREGKLKQVDTEMEKHVMEDQNYANIYYII